MEAENMKITSFYDACQKNIGSYGSWKLSGEPENVRYSPIKWEKNMKIVSYSPRKWRQKP
jgi:hypothetical protein